MPPDPPSPPSFVSRAGLKLRHALDSFAIEPTGWRCADFGCNVGGFTDCLLQAGAAHVTAIDTGYGAFAWKLRNDPRVTVMERTNALHAPPPAEHLLCDLVVIDMAWTPQRLAIPAAVPWLRKQAVQPAPCIISLIKPHYEVTPTESRTLLRHGVLDPADGERIALRVLEDLTRSMPSIAVAGFTRSPLLGGAGKGSSRGNAEWLALLSPAPSQPDSHRS